MRIEGADQTLFMSLLRHRLCGLISRNLIRWSEVEGQS